MQVTFDADQKENHFKVWSFCCQLVGGPTEQAVSDQQLEIRLLLPEMQRISFKDTTLTVLTLTGNTPAISVTQQSKGLLKRLLFQFQSKL